MVIKSGEFASATAFRRGAGQVWPRYITGMLVLVVSFGVGCLYLLWMAAYFCTCMFFSPDPLLHTRTTLARRWERLTFAPNSVTYYLEHHFLPSVPKYRIEEFRAALRKKRLLEGADITVGYLLLLRKLTAKPVSL